MKANELRIGNYYLDFDDEIQQIEMIQPFMFGFKYRWEWEKYIKPIPLTEEILLKCGFVQCENEYWYTNGILNLSLPIGTFSINGSKNSEAVIRINPIKHLHQLQNLYFALTNEELTVNL